MSVRSLSAQKFDEKRELLVRICCAHTHSGREAVSLVVSLDEFAGRIQCAQALFWHSLCLLWSLGGNRRSSVPSVMGTAQQTATFTAHYARRDGTGRGESLVRCWQDKERICGSFRRNKHSLLYLSNCLLAPADDGVPKEKANTANNKALTNKTKPNRKKRRTVGKAGTGKKKRNRTELPTGEWVVSRSHLSFVACVAADNGLLERTNNHKNVGVRRI